MDECKRMGLEVLGPDVNESYAKFTVNKNGAIRFGLAAIRGVGTAAVEGIIKERNENGLFKDMYDFVERVDLSAINKRNVEGLAMAGGFDNLSQLTRSQFFAETGDGTFSEVLIKYGSKMKLDKSANQNTLFGGDDSIEIQQPEAPKVPEWDKIDRLNKEKELIGIYLSAHPLDDFKLEIDNFTNTRISDFNDIKKLKGKEVKIAGIISAVEHRTTKTGKPFGSITIEDYSDSYKMTLFSKDYLENKQYFTEGYFLFMEGRVQHRFNNDSNELEFKPTKMDMLSEIREKKMKSISLKITIDKLDNELIQELESVVIKHKGNTALKFLIYEPSSSTWIQMHSRNHKLNISQELLDYITASTKIQDYKIA